MNEDRLIVVKPLASLVGVVVYAAMAAIVLLVVPPAVAHVATLFVALTLAAGLALYGLSIYRGLRSYARLNRFLASTTGVDGDGVRLGRGVLAEYGRVHVYYRRGHRHSVGIVEFPPLEAPVVRDRLSFRRDGYLVVLQPAAAIMPAYRVRDPCCPGVIVAAVGSAVSKCLSPSTLSVCSDDGDCAYARIECSNAVVHVELDYRPVSGQSRGARVELEVEARVAGRLVGAKRVLASTTALGRTVEGVELAPAETAYIVFTAESSPSLVVSSAARMRVFEGVAADADYRIHLVLDRPLARDVRATVHAEPV